MECDHPKYIMGGRTPEPIIKQQVCAVARPIKPKPENSLNRMSMICLGCPIRVTSLVTSKLDPVQALVI